DGGDAITLDGYVGGVPGIAGAIDDVAVADDEVVVDRVGHGFKRSAVGRCRDLAQRLSGDGLGGVGVRRPRDVIYVGGEYNFFAAGGDYVAGQPFSIEHHFGVELVFGAECSGFRENMPGGGVGSLNLGERAVFAEDGKRFEEEGVIGASGPVGEILAHEIGAEEIGPIAAGSIALGDPGEIE